MGSYPAAAGRTFPAVTGCPRYYAKENHEIGSPFLFCALRTLRFSYPENLQIVDFGVNQGWCCLFECWQRQRLVVLQTTSDAFFSDLLFQTKLEEEQFDVAVVVFSEYRRKKLRNSLFLFPDPKMEAKA